MINEQVYRGKPSKEREARNNVKLMNIYNVLTYSD